MDESEGHEPAETYPKKKTEEGAKPQVDAQSSADGNQEGGVPRPSRITVVRSSKSRTDLPAVTYPGASADQTVPSPRPTAAPQSATQSLQQQPHASSQSVPQSTSQAASHSLPQPAAQVPPQTSVQSMPQSTQSPTDFSRPSPGNQSTLEPTALTSDTVESSDSSTKHPGISPAEIQDQTETVLNSAISKPIVPDQPVPGSPVTDMPKHRARETTGSSGPIMLDNLSISQQGLKPFDAEKELPGKHVDTKFVLPSPDQPVPPPQAPPQFLGDQGHTRPSDSSMDRSQFGTASKHGGAPIALLTNTNRKRKKKPASPTKFSNALEFARTNWITSILTLSMVLLATLLFVNKDPKLENVTNLDLSILTTGQGLEEVNRLIEQKKYEPALALCNSIIQKDNKFAEAYHSRGQVYMAMHRFHEAADDYTTAESYNPRSIDIHIDRAAALYNMQDYDKAKREYQLILTAEPHNAAAFFGKGLAEQNSGQSTEALEDFQHTLENRSDYAAAYEGMGTIHFAAGDMKKSYEDYTNAIKIAPTIPRFYFNRANALKQDHQTTRAIADYCKAIQLDATRPEFFNNRGLLYLENNEPAKAMTDFSSAVDLDPSYTIAKHNLTLAQERLRR